MKSAIKRMITVVAIISAAAVIWAIVSIVGYGTTFERDEFQGVKKGMSRLEVVDILRKSGVTELESEPAQEVHAKDRNRDASSQSGQWIDLGKAGSEASFYEHEVWRYQVPGSYSTVDIRFAGDKLISIKYRWRPFEG